MNFRGSNLTWILVLLLILGDGDNGGTSCDTLIWLLLLSRYCGGNCGCGCGDGNRFNFGGNCGN